MSIQTEQALHEFTRDAVSRLAEVLNGSAPEFEDDIRFERGADGHFRGRKMSFRTSWPALSPEWLRSLPNYEKRVTCLKADVVIGPHLDRLVGTSPLASMQKKS